MKKYLKCVVLIIIVIGLIASISFNIYLLFDSKQEIEEVSENNKTLICTNTIEVARDLTSTYTYRLEIDETGGVNEYELEIIDIYEDEDEYNQNKNEVVDNCFITYDDQNYIINKVYNKAKITINTDEISVWYINYKTQMEKNGYTCEIYNNYIKESNNTF